MRIVGLIGYAGSGKSEIAKHLSTPHYGFVLMKFAGVLKGMMRAAGLSDREIEGDLKEVPCKILGGRTPRYAMQTLGVDWGRCLIHRELWVLLMEKQLEERRTAHPRVVIDDCRFRNEERLIRARGGQIWRVVRPGVEAVYDHVSEREHEGVKPDRTIANIADIAHLKREVDLAMSQWG